MQYNHSTRLAVHKRCAEAINLSMGYIKEINDRVKNDQAGKATRQDEIDIRHLESRIKELKLSILIVYNTQRIKEMREMLVTGWRAQLADTNPLVVLKGDEIKLREQQIRIIDRTLHCKNPLCQGKGWTGIREKAGEFQLCNCTLKTINFYVTVDTPIEEPNEEEEAPAQPATEEQKTEPQ